MPNSSFYSHFVFHQQQRLCSFALKHTQQRAQLPYVQLLSRFQTDSEHGSPSQFPTSPLMGQLCRISQRSRAAPRWSNPSLVWCYSTTLPPELISKAGPDTLTHIYKPQHTRQEQVLSWMIWVDLHLLGTANSFGNELNGWRAVNFGHGPSVGT